MLAGLLLLGIVLAVAAGGGEAPIMPAGARESLPAGAGGGRYGGGPASTPAGGSAAAAATVVSLTFDDGRASQYANALPALRAHGLHATFYLNSAHVEDSAFFMTWAQVHALADAGNEIGGHTLDHPKLTLLGSPNVVREVCGDRANLIKEGFHPTAFAYPYGAYNGKVESIVKGCGYQSARAVGGLVSRFDRRCTSCAFAERVPPAYPYAIRSPDSVMSTTTLSDLKTLVTQAEASGGGWVPLVFHDVCDNACQLYSIAPASFNAFLDWLLHEVARRAVSVQTVQQVLSASRQQ